MLVKHFGFQLRVYLYSGPEDCARGDQVTCGQCGQRFPLADLTGFVQHKMAASCSRPETQQREASRTEAGRVEGSGAETSRMETDRPEASRMETDRTEAIRMETDRTRKSETNVMEAGRRAEVDDTEAELRRMARASLSSPRVSGTDEVVKREEETGRQGREDDESFSIGLSLSNLSMICCCGISFIQ